NGSDTARTGQQAAPLPGGFPGRGRHLESGSATRPGHRTRSPARSRRMHLRPVAGPPRCKPRTAARRDPRPARRTRGGAAAEMKANPIIDRLARAEFVRFEGRVTAIGSGFVEGDGPLAKLGDYCTIGSGDASRLVLAEVIAV